MSVSKQIVMLFCYVLPRRVDVLRHVDCRGQAPHEQTPESQKLLILKKTFAQQFVRDRSEMNQNQICLKSISLKAQIFRN